MADKKKTDKPERSDKKPAAPKAADKKVTVVKKAAPRKAAGTESAAETTAKAPKAAPVKDEQPKRVKEKREDTSGRIYATGRRKTSAARVWIRFGTGKIIVNGKPYDKYFARPVLQMIVGQPLEATQKRTQIDIWSTVKGGGLSGQAGAIRHGISRALDEFDPTLHKVLRQGGYLTRDSRTVERKKYGRAKARRSFQFSKR